MPRRHERGFTLVELLVVVLVLGILGALTLPGFRTGLARHQLDTTARILAADFREVQALTQNEETETVVFSMVFLKRGYFISRSSRSVKSVDYPPGISMTSATFTGTEVRFYDGSVSPESTGGKVLLKHGATGLTSAVVVTPVTGRVRIENSWEVADGRK